MKFQFKNGIAVMAIVFTLFSCTDKNDEVITGEGNLKLEQASQMGMTAQGKHSTS